MTGGQEKSFSTLGPKLRGSKTQQYYGDKQRQICIEVTDYIALLAFFIKLSEPKIFRLVYKAFKKPNKKFQDDRITENKPEICIIFA